MLLVRRRAAVAVGNRTAEGEAGGQHSLPYVRERWIRDGRRRCCPGVPSLPGARLRRHPRERHRQERHCRASYPQLGDEPVRPRPLLLPRRLAVLLVSCEAPSLRVRRGDRERRVGVAREREEVQNRMLIS